MLEDWITGIPQSGSRPAALVPTVTCSATEVAPPYFAVLLILLISIADVNIDSSRDGGPPVSLQLLPLETRQIKISQPHTRSGPSRTSPSRQALPADGTRAM